MKKLSFIYVLLAGALVISSCKKEEPIDNGGLTANDTTSNGTPSGSDLNAFVNNNIANATQTFTIDASNPALITGAKGTKIQFYNGQFQTMSGDAVTSGNIDIALIEIFDKKDMILLNKQTLGEHQDGTKEVLISGGEFKITASQNGQPLQLTNGSSYEVTVPAPNGVNPNMELFTGDNSSDTMIWTEVDSSSIWGQGNEYNCFFDNLNWVNCDYFMDYGVQMSDIQIEMPNGFNNTNCLLYLYFDNENAVTNIYSYQGSGVFSLGNYQVPVGIDVHIVAYAMINNTVHSAIVPVTVTNNHYEVIPSLDPTTQSQFETDLQNLP